MLPVRPHPWSDGPPLPRRRPTMKSTRFDEGPRPDPDPRPARARAPCPPRGRRTLAPRSPTRAASSYNGATANGPSTSIPALRCRLRVHSRLDQHGRRLGDQRSLQRRPRLWERLRRQHGPVAPGRGSSRNVDRCLHDHCRQRLNPAPYAHRLRLPTYHQKSDGGFLFSLLNSGTGHGATSTPCPRCPTRASPTVSRAPRTPPGSTPPECAAWPKAPPAT